mgnify:CR=1 FL=1|tara:strand:- start:589 stop:975 length:387 start_codon:yes stop_codon:yes gene_type:complete
MNSSNEDSLLTLFLPDGILDYFDIIDHQIVDREERVYRKTLTIHLQEKNIIPSEFENYQIKGAGFMPARVIDDYPIRNMLVKLCIKRRRWEVSINDKPKKVTRNWNLVAQGCRMSEDYSTFLKGISRF